uniref:Uncharacterized protein n=1 Tax=Roseihalotalea indica TaxID=2867963 RepID=A0AA49JJK5_9BACT|nr:hypothetical protein K4G66_14170 [Tunicatimonas sp. TK19036]
MKKIVIFLILSFTTELFSGFRSYEDKFVKVEVSEDISVSLPQSFQKMTEDQMQQKFLSARPPLAAYTSPDQVADFGVNVSNTRWQASDLPILKDFYRSSLLELYDEIDFVEEGIHTVNNAEMVYFEFTSVVKQDEDSIVPKPPVHQYTYVQYAIHKDKALVFTFSCPTRRKEQWQPTAQRIMTSVKMK